MDLGHLTQAHANNTLVPTLNNLSHPHCKCEWLLSGIFCTPKLFGEVSVFAKACAMDCYLLASPRKLAIACPDECFCEAHIRQEVVGDRAGNLR